MPKIPGSESLGGPNIPRGTRPIITGADTGAGLVGRGIEKVGATVSAISEEQRRQDDALDLIKADTALKEGLATTRREFETDPDYKTYGPRFDEKVTPLTESAGSLIKNPNTREKWLARAKGDVIGARESVLHHGLGLEREHKEFELEGILSKRQGDYAATRDPEQRAAILRDIQEKAHLAEQTGLVRPKKAAHLRERFIDSTIELDIAERAYDDPEGVLRDFGVIPGGKRPASVTSSPLKIENQGEHSVVNAGSGAKFRVSSTYADRFAGFIADLEAAGVEVKGDQSGGYAKRNIRGTNTPSKHSHGEAIDINWHENAEGKPGALSERLGDDKVRELARKHGLKWGADFKGRSRDDMHFEVDKDAVVRRDLPAPVGASPEEDPAPDVMPFGDPDAPPSPEEMASPTRSQYAMLSGKRRQVMINKARIALSHTYQRKLADDFARVEDGGDEERDERGETAFDRASRILQPNVLAQWKTKRDKAYLKRDSLRALEDMPEDRVDDHIRSIGRDPRTGEEREDFGYANIKAVREQAEKQWEKIRQKRRTDPAAAVAQSPEVQRAAAVANSGSKEVAIAMDEYGDPVFARPDLTPIQQRVAATQIVEATMAAQERLGVPKDYQRRISKRQAEKLLDMRNPEKLTSQQQREALAAAAKRASDLFGPEVGEKVFEDALILSFNPNADNLRQYRNRGREAFESGAAEQERFKLLAKKAFGGSISQQDMGRVQQLERLDAIPPILPRVNQGVPGIGQPPPRIPQQRQPSEAHTKLLLQQMAVDPVKAREIFDSKFGEGAAKRVMSRMIEGEAESP